MKRSLIITGYYPLPEVTGGFIRTMNFARFFRKLGTVDLVCPELEPDNNRIDNDIFDNEYFLGNTDYPKNFIERIYAVLKGRVYPIRSFKDSYKEYFYSILEKNKYDYILVRYIANAFDLFKCPNIIKNKIILDIDDLLSNTLYETFFYQTKSIHRKILRSINKLLLKHYENRCLKLNIPVFCSEKDMNKFNENKVHGFVVPNIYSNNEFYNYDFGDGFNNKYNLLFVGMLAYTPNIIGLKWFIETIYPKFKQVYLNSKLFVVGNVGLLSEYEIKKLCEKYLDIELHTNVVSVKDYYKRSMAIIVPLLSGGGTRIKILEAALADRAILSTPVGSEGLDMEDGKELLIFNNAAEFIRNFKKICDNEIYKRLTKNAKEKVNTNYSIKNFERSMHKVLTKIDNIKGN